MYWFAVNVQATQFLGRSLNSSLYSSGKQVEQNEIASYLQKNVHYFESSLCFYVLFIGKKEKKKETNKKKLNHG